MIPRKQIIFSRKKIGVLLILFILIISTNNINAQNGSLNIRDLKILAEQFKNQNQPFMAYFYYLSFYMLTKDKKEKLNAGLEALDLSILNNQFEEAKHSLSLLWSDFPSLKNKFLFKYGVSLLSTNNFIESDIYLRQVKYKTQCLKNKIYFLRAFIKLNTNEPKKCLSFLGQIDSTFTYYGAVNSIKNKLIHKKIKKKYKLISIPLSILIPGAGQAYSGFYFDALQDFGFNLILGYATYSSWRYEFSLDRHKRNYILPVLSTIVWGVFYLTNIYNSINSVDRTNLYLQNEFYGNVINKFNLVLKNKKYFLELNFGI